MVHESALSHEHLVKHGWVVFTSVAAASEVLHSLGRPWGVEDLVPKEADDADKWSLSGVYGKSVFPWHTDGAVSRRPPRYLVLECIEAEDETPTELLRPSVELLALLRGTILKISDRSGRRLMYACATPSPDGQLLRWDPRIGAASKNETVLAVEAAEPTEAIRWAKGNVAVIDNHAVLHRRPATGPGTRVLRRSYIGGANVGL